MSQHPNDYQKRTLWTAVTGLSIVVITAILVGLIWLIGKTLSFLQPVLVPLAVAGITAYLLDPIVNWLQAKKKLSRLKAVLTVFLGSLLLFVLASLTVIPPIIKQTGALIDDRDNIGKQTVQRLESFQEHPIISPIVDWALTPVDADGNEYVGETPVPDELDFSDRKLGYHFTQNLSKISQATLSILRGSTSKVLGLFGYAIGFIMVPIYLYYFLNESSSIKSNWQNYVPLKASKFKTEVIDTLTEINGYLISFFRGQVLVAIIDGLLVGIALSIFQLPYGFVIGIFLGVLGVIPFIGNIICMIPACIIAYVHFSTDLPNHQWFGDNPWAYVGAVILIFLVVQQINSLVTAPKIVGDSVGLHPMTVIFSMLFWSLILGGFLGTLLAVPMTAAIKVIFRRYVWERKITEHLPPRDFAENDPRTDYQNS